MKKTKNQLAEGTG